MVGGREGGVFDAGDGAPEGFDEGARGCGGAVGVVCRVEAVEDEHCCYHVLLERGGRISCEVG